MKEPLRSELVERVMADASDDAKREATRRWFGFLRTLMRIVDESSRDSREKSEDVRFDA